MRTNVDVSFSGHFTFLTHFHQSYCHFIFMINNRTNNKQPFDDVQQIERMKLNAVCYKYRRFHWPVIQHFGSSLFRFFFFSMLVEALISRCKTNEARWTLCIGEKTHTHATQFTSKRAAIISRVDRQPCIDMRSMCGDCNQKFICTQYCN